MLSIGFIHIEQRLATIRGKCRLAVADPHRPIETGTPAGVAGCIVAQHIHAQPDGVLVTIREHLDDLLDIAGGLALLPKRLAPT